MSTPTPESTQMPSPGSSPANAPTPKTKPDNALPGLILNILLPVLILNKMEKWVPAVGPWGTLFIALSFPLAAAFKDYWIKRKISPLSGLGALNVIGTGGLAALGVGGIWFAVKEAFFPLVIGIGVLVSTYMKKTAAEALFFSTAIFRVDEIRSTLAARGNEGEFKKSLKTATVFLAGSFFLSSVLNFVLAMAIFEPFAEGLSQVEKTQALNQQVAQMTWMSFAVIALPSFICTAAAFWGLVRAARRLTGLKDSEIFVE